MTLPAVARLSVGLQQVRPDRMFPDEALIG